MGDCGSTSWHCWTTITAAIVVLGCVSVQTARAQENREEKPPVYDPSPQHLWNRLHEAIFVRVGPNGQEYGRDRLDPLLWHGTMHLLVGESNERVVRLLDEFVAAHAEKLIEEPMKRALLQRDLWMEFNWLDGDHAVYQVPQEDWKAARERLRTRLAAVIGRVALRPDQIDALPDNYAAAVAAGEFAKAYDPSRPDRTYLPADLFAADGPWVCVGRADGPVATRHLQDTNSYANSAFLAFLQLPGGRTATLDYLKQLADFSGSMVVEVDDSRRSTGRTRIPNPRLPQFPIGTQVALVRRALLISNAHEIVPTRLTESVQFRAYREIPAISVQTMDDALVGGTPGNRRARDWQAFQEFRLSRGLPSAGRAVGLRAVSAGERDFDTGLGSHGRDAFEDYGQSFGNGAQLHSVMQTCFACHSLPGVYSFNSFQNFRITNVDGDVPRPGPLREVSLSDATTTVRWKQSRPEWKSLRKLLAP